MSDTIAAQQHLFDPGEPTHLSLQDRFLVPPFSVLDARAGYWQKRKRDWLSLGIHSELGRDEKLLGYESLVNTKPCPACAGKGIIDGQRCRGCKGTGDQYGNFSMLHTTSVFDPVLCEVVYRWFAPRAGTVLDPFAGGSVRGIVAAALERGYLGIDLRPEQVESNYAQLGPIAARHALEPRPEWVVGDSRELPRLLGTHTFDAAFTCPPYFDLERYSKDPRDLSNAGEWSAFRKAYREIIAHTVAALKPDSFAVWVVGDIRQKTKPSGYRCLVPATIRAFLDAGCIFYNECILLTMLGTAPVRVAAQFGGGRKLGKVHQNVLVFCKGDPYAAAAKVPVEEVAVEQGGAVWRADGSAEVPATGEEYDPGWDTI